jgi:glucosamine kinase
MAIHFVGVDGGATRTRALLATEAGRVVGEGAAAGANSFSSEAPAARSITEAMHAALGDVAPASVEGGVIAVAGGGALLADVARDIRAGWRSLGLPGSVHIVSDVVTAYTAGTTAPEGLVVAAGTGAVAAWIDGGASRRRAGGHGWLVGDEGSAVWLGVEGTRAALRAIDGRGPETTLAAIIPETLGVEAADDEALVARVITTIYSDAPAQMGRLAPAVVAAGEAGDAVAAGLVEAAAGHLIDIGVAAAGPDSPPVVVLAGSLLTRVLPIRERVEARLVARWPEAELRETSDGVAGAVALAISRHEGTPIGDEVLARLHDRGR